MPLVHTEAQLISRLQAGVGGGVLAVVVASISATVALKWGDLFPPKDYDVLNAQQSVRNRGMVCRFSFRSANLNSRGVENRAAVTSISTLDKLGVLILPGQIRLQKNFVAWNINTLSILTPR